ncbi:hypothetical protein BDZ94DRAFT_1231768 [Collybia nuda]|uniref:Uncharacterized protein n=1 Tax=Collybia nuda TaxID=64659 RepID=A0A9P6CKC0_9AGAR|nr:hypothetical protein BDZ94DRAFT_1231768 [Collybia nuda]
MYESSTTVFHNNPGKSNRRIVLRTEPMRWGIWSTSLLVVYRKSVGRGGTRIDYHGTRRDEVGRKRVRWFRPQCGVGLHSGGEKRKTSTNELVTTIDVGKEHVQTKEESLGEGHEAVGRGQCRAMTDVLDGCGISKLVRESSFNSGEKEAFRWEDSGIVNTLTGLEVWNSKSKYHRRRPTFIKIMTGGLIWVFVADFIRKYGDYKVLLMESCNVFIYILKEKYIFSVGYLNTGGTIGTGIAKRDGFDDTGIWTMSKKVPWNDVVEWDPIPGKEKAIRSGV